MAPRPDPPYDSKEMTEYLIGDKVYYFRSNKWRCGEIRRKAGTSAGSPVYEVFDDEKQDERLIADTDIRLKS